jgi:hypothetical protein
MVERIAERLVGRDVDAVAYAAIHTRERGISRETAGSYEVKMMLVWRQPW